MVFQYIQKSWGTVRPHSMLHKKFRKQLSSSQWVWLFVFLPIFLSLFEGVLQESFVSLQCICICICISTCICISIHVWRSEEEEGEFEKFRNKCISIWESFISLLTVYLYLYLHLHFYLYLYFYPCLKEWRGGGGVWKV